MPIWKGSCNRILSWAYHHRYQPLTSRGMILEVDPQMSAMSFPLSLPRVLITEFVEPFALKMVQAADAKTELITASAARHGMSKQSKNFFNEYLQKLSGTYGVSSFVFANQFCVWLWQYDKCVFQLRKYFLYSWKNEVAWWKTDFCGIW